jgi:hypothetical protein
MECMNRKLTIAVLLLLALLIGSAPHHRAAFGQTKPRAAKAGKAKVDPGQPRDFRSPRFLVHADLSDTEAKELLARLEKMYDLIGAYWGRQIKPGQLVEMYVVKDIKRWPQGSIPAEGLPHILGGGGVTQTQAISTVGEQGQRVHLAAQTVCFAVADRGTPQHEAVHAFCGLTFGQTGPTWYSEGMAEMGNYWRGKDHSVQLDPQVLEYLQQNSIKSLNAIVNNQEHTGDSWQNYVWRWALCHLLANNPNYRGKFQPLGMDLLLDRPNSFEKTYGAMAAEISFEYKHFIDTIQNGLRVDLTAIDWKKKFLPLQAGKSGPSSTIAANRGWQPSQAIVGAEQTYAYSTTGKWSVGKGAKAVSAAGDDKLLGRLLGAVLAKDDAGNYQLSEEFSLDTDGEFRPPASGKLFLRCGDEWGQLANNTGRITFKIKLAEL